jgi:hypothetical protein
MLSIFAASADFHQLSNRYRQIDASVVVEASCVEFGLGPVSADPSLLILNWIQHVKARRTESVSGERIRFSERTCQARKCSQLRQKHVMFIPFQVDPSWYERYWWREPAPNRTAYRWRRVRQFCRAYMPNRERLLRAAELAGYRPCLRCRPENSAVLSGVERVTAGQCG